jgi:hypothetical protein
MALINCPECNHRVSDQALTCPNCGYPIERSSQPDLERILCAGTWSAESGTLVDAILDATFSSDHSFQGQTRPDPRRVVGLQLVAHARFQGRWQVAGPQLFLDFPLTMASGPAQTQIAIQFNRISDDALSGVDAFLRGWEWRKIAEASQPSSTHSSPLEEHEEKQAALAKTLQNLADMRHKMLANLAERLDEQERAAERQPDVAPGPRKKKRPGDHPSE